jgi:glycosyltransferase involved in cell wall biosynthesis
MSNSTVRLSVVLPCYNEALGLPSLAARYAETGHGVPFELILVDNGSADDTPRVMADLVAQYPFARTVRVVKNQGYGNGILTGLRAARGEAVCWSHADLQTDPADVFRAWDLYRQASQPQRMLVKGRRSGRRLTDRVITWGMQTTATLLLRTPMYEINAQPKLFHRDLLRALVDAPLDWSLDVYALYAAKRCGWRVVTFPVAFPPRQHGTSNWASSWKSKYRTIARSIKYLATLARQPRPQLAANEAAFINGPTKRAA